MGRIRKRIAGLALVLALVCAQLSGQVWAAMSQSVENPALTARLIAAENGVAPGAGTLSLGLELRMQDDWKAYWRTPGEVGYPPQIDWSGSRNLAEAQILWPAPERFTAFGIENFGYRDHVVLPIRAVLETPGAPASLNAAVSLLTCADICVPHDFTLTLDLPAGAGIDAPAAALITAFAERVPLPAAQGDIAVVSAHIDADALVIAATSARPFQSPDVFPEMGEAFAFGPPDIRMNSARTALWARLPVLSAADAVPALQVTLTDSARAVTAAPAWADTPAQPPFSVAARLPDAAQIVSIVLIAFLGGLILNVMPCVLPVLSIKLASVMGQRDKPARVVRGGFVMSALGVLAFMWVLAAAVLALQALGFSVGWGLQFQSPVFLSLMILVLVVFSANLFGWFEIALPSGLQTRLANSGARDGYLGDFATGAFAAVLATPCSAPFLGTAIAFALTGRAIDVVVVFTALGLGLALPYLVFAARPSMVRVLPKPGRWMLAVKLVLGGLLVLTALWLLWVLTGVSGVAVSGAVLALALGFALLAARPLARPRAQAAALTVLALAPLALAAAMVPPPAAQAAAAHWVAFDRGEIARRVSQGQTVFVDVTADWCLSCKANKALVLDRDPVASLLRAPGTVAMRADWTRPDPAITRFLESHGRYGIPFNIVFGPAAPEGVALSELLTASAVQSAIGAASGAARTQ
ncbi:MAG: protein-disulfide reductase DsbD family protein [Rhodobacteraceae bacterium]|nr:protein-disulfide reductase DsbD family protein [Paracoccaceae bacterium]